MKPPSPEQIAWLEQSANAGNSEHQLILWLLDRLAALEAQQPAPQPTAAELEADADADRLKPLWQLMYEAATAELNDNPHALPKEVYHVVILAVADWLMRRGLVASADQLRQEADR